MVADPSTMDSAAKRPAMPWATRSSAVEVKRQTALLYALSDGWTAFYESDFSKSEGLFSGGDEQSWRAARGAGSDRRGGVVVPVERRGGVSGGDGQPRVAARPAGGDRRGGDLASAGGRSQGPATPGGARQTAGVAQSRDEAAGRAGRCGGVPSAGPRAPYRYVITTAGWGSLSDPPGVPHRIRVPPRQGCGQSCQLASLHAGLADGRPAGTSPSSSHRSRYESRR